MNNNIKKFISIFLLATIFFSALPLNILVEAKTSTEEEIHVFVDGVKFKASIDDEDNIYVTSLNKENKTKIEYSPLDEVAYVDALNEEDKKETFKLQINDFDIDNNIDILIFDENGMYYDRFTDVDQLELDSYSGQMAIALPVAAKVLFEIALSVLIIKEVIDLVDSFTEYGYKFQELDQALVSAIAKDKTLKKYYYPAKIKNNKVYIALNAPLTLETAKPFVYQNQKKYMYNLYSATSNMASSIISYAGFSYQYHPAHNGKNAKKGVYFRHYHKKTHSAFHSFYGKPYIVK